MRRIDRFSKKQLNSLRLIDKKYQKKKRKRLNGYKAEEYRKWRKKNPEKQKAHVKLNYAIRTGKIIKSPCVECGDAYRIQGHHPDYSKPLEVIWVCSIHHKDLHQL